MSLRRARALSLLRSMAGQRVLVAGDVMLDAFLWGRAARLSPEPARVVASKLGKATVAPQELLGALGG